MKNIKKVLLLLLMMTITINNNVYAAGDSTDSEGFSAKYIFIGFAFLVIILLLFLGYRIDTKGEDIVRSPKPNKKQAKKEAINTDVAYEEDKNTTYQADESVSNDDLNDSIEYVDDDEYDNSIDNIEDESSNYFDNNVEEIDNNHTNDSEESLLSVNENEENNEDLGEEFDTSILDNLDDEETDEEEIPTTNNTKKSFDETIVFDNKLEDEIDSLDDENNDIVSRTDDDSFINELKNFKEPESNFSGFSVKKDNKNEINIEEEETINDVPNVNNKNLNNAVTDNFLHQMELNLEKNKDNSEDNDNH